MNCRDMIKGGAGEKPREERNRRKTCNLKNTTSCKHTRTHTFDMSENNDMRRKTGDTANLNVEVIRIVTYGAEAEKAAREQIHKGVVLYFW